MNPDPTARHDQSKSIRNILLDRDGTVIEDRHYLNDPDEVVLLPGAAQGLKILQESGMRLFLVTNQSGIGRGYFHLSRYEAVHERMCQLLAGQGVTIEDAVFCPHAPYERCACRKPAPGMWDTLSRRHGIAPHETVMIGDKKADIQFSRRAGLALAILVCTGYGGQEETRKNHLLEDSGPDRPDVVADDLHAAAKWILNQKS
ncbi:MAG: D-glycero-alpha-D-manno-heptose-1,7-bisphosphate 7-phosphatase [Desulfovibrionales bacterium]